MKAAVYYDQSDVRYEEISRPKIKAGEILVEMRACGLCGSDLMEWYLKERTPLVLGHEPSGVIAEIGDRIKAFEVGDRVFAHHHVACLTCYYCVHGDYTLCAKFKSTHLEPGGFAEYFKVPAPNVQVDTLKLPDNVSFLDAALIEPIACCIRGIEKCNFRLGDTVAVIGAGPTGLIQLELAKILGANQVIVSDPVNFRLRAAKEFGADIVINPLEEDVVEKVREATDRRGADIVVLTAPSGNATSTAIDICRKGGVLCLFAPASPEETVRMKPHQLFFSEISVIPSYSTSHLETRKAVSLLQTGRIRAGEFITHRYGLDQVEEALSLATKSKECLKIVIESR
ncbi:MAG: alcohol dehydrogenase catalytic domain-containing protein [Nitrososphaeria archaeon]|nr:alcohol dehydrogenase catalytic domain-containing protein [Nitrososphaeria archaeon]NIN52248.1 alcohol dehydrogenase catalytic domain-containing protein [Nitrososphaeria archaeon]NIQ32704.1 alcohol dehydrogenase catalytic domain-containing protein [Nitrososphaeria archaeon]